MVAHKATTWPTFDPTWYGMPTIILSLLEIDLATITAALPVFWPHLRRNMMLIMVTREVEVRTSPMDEEVGVGSGGGGGGGGAAPGAMMTGPTESWEKRESVVQLQQQPYAVREPPRLLVKKNSMSRSWDLQRRQEGETSPGSTYTNPSEESFFIL